VRKLIADAVTGGHHAQSLVINVGKVKSLISADLVLTAVGNRIGSSLRILVQIIMRVIRWGPVVHDAVAIARFVEVISNCAYSLRLRRHAAAVLTPVILAVRIGI